MLRVTLAQAGLVLVPQYVVHLDDEFIARLDLAFPHLKIAVEYDGAWHADPAQHRRDQARLRRLRSAGWEMITVTANDLHGAPDKVINAVYAAVRQRS